MAASTLTIGNWTHELVNNVNVWTCKVTQTTSDLDNYTKKTPKGLDTTKPWTLVINSAVASLDDATLPADLYIGWDDSFALTLNNPPTVTGGVLYKADFFDSVETAAAAILMHPNLTVAEDTSGGAAKMYVPVAPYYIIDLDGAGALLATTCTYKIMQ
jgi:hypothetical protein